MVSGLTHDKSTWIQHAHTPLLSNASVVNTLREGIFTVAVIGLQTYRAMTKRQRGSYQTPIPNITLFGHIVWRLV